MLCFPGAALYSEFTTASRAIKIHQENLTFIQIKADLSPFGMLSSLTCLPPTKNPQAKNSKKGGTPCNMEIPRLNESRLVFLVHFRSGYNLHHKRNMKRLLRFRRVFKRNIGERRMPLEVNDFVVKIQRGTDFNKHLFKRIYRRDTL